LPLAGSTAINVTALFAPARVKNGAHSRAVGKLGSVKKNVVPLPGVLSAQISPPWRVTRSFEIRRPRPEPLRLVFSEPSFWRV
jgi:hypothetical protein